ncbi:AAA family ATPase [uncultured Treponema sp.]|mgnify:FL=1|uniref:AAA family ATPase n=1 Tax=uncultured Treponema sp. TaxID=162155 RepID=UPI002598336E|nr:AAA family ATPase [uncultured Treponema sp.]
MFPDLLDKNIQPKEIIISEIPEIHLSEGIKKKLTEMFVEEENGYVKVSDFTTTVAIDKNYVFFPNQYFYLAILCKNYAEALFKYCDFFDNNVKNNSSLKEQIINQHFSNTKYTSFFNNIEDSKFFSDFIIGGEISSFRPGKNLVNGDKYRGTKDIFGSCILKKISIPDASSNYFGSIVYYLTKRNDLYSQLDSEIYQQIKNNNNFIKQNSVLSSTQHPSQIIYYGVPGSGKSHRIDEDTKNVPDEQKMRVVFHPEYTNADFVGQIVPRVDDGVDYRFKAGPFSRILKRAYQNIDKPFYLIIEEINRGNASAIFGDLFQLLDRDESGYSKYSVENLDINSYIRSKDNLYNDKEVPSTVKVGDTEWTEITGIRLPPNLSILATMNTSDQNVFALDNAFQRRWDMELVENKFLISNESSEDEKEKAKKQASAIIELPQANLTYTWQQFQSIINSIISEKSNSTELSSMEDKRLGCWFVKACEYESENKEKKFGISKKIFANKVLKYLWDDAFKFCHQEIFSAEIFDFENLQNIFYKRGFGIFSEESGIVNILNSLQSSDTTTQTPAEEASGN